MPGKPLRPVDFPAHYKLADIKPAPGIDISSPATCLMVDFRLHPVITLPGNTPLEEAQHTLKNSHRSVIMVVDSDDQVCGVVSQQALTNQSIMARLGKGGSRADLQVADFMTPRAELTAVSLGDIEEASVGKVISLLREEGLATVLVVDDSSREVVGLLAAAEIEKILGLEVKPAFNPSFMSIFDAVMH